MSELEMLKDLANGSINIGYKQAKIDIVQLLRRRIPHEAFLIISLEILSMEYNHENEEEN